MFKVLVLPLLFVSGQLLAATTSIAQLDVAQFTAQIKEKVAGRPAFQGTALLVQGRNVLWSYQHGSTAAGKPFDQHSAFFVGSISKTVAALLVMQQVEHGTLDLQAPVQRYLPQLRQQWASRVRLADLLSHTSGLIDLQTQQHYGQFRYNNLNFQLLGQILTAVTQRPYAELASDLLRACQMQNAGFEVKPDTVSQGWQEEQGQLKAITGFMPVEAQPSGGLIASAADIGLLPLCLQQQLSKSSLSQMSQAVVLRQHRWGQVHYGYGMQISQTAAGTEWSHGGYIPGYVSVFNYYPEHQLTLVVLENQALDPADFGRAAYYHDKLRELVISNLSQHH
jgi:D-alanyl-D-alanine carboxypeptidase